MPSTADGTSRTGEWAASRAGQQPASRSRADADTTSAGTVVVSVLPQAWFVDRLAPESVTVSVMIPPGAGHATYEPTVDQLREVARARLYVTVGHPGFAWETAWLDRLIASGPDLRVVDGSDGCRLLPQDPHVWLSPDCARHLAANIAEALVAVYPDESDGIRGRLRRLEADIDSLDADLSARLAPFRGRAFLVFHPAWGYFAEAYGLEQIAIQRGVAEPGLHGLGELIERAREENIDVVFVQPQFSETSARVVAREIGGRVVRLDPLARDWPRSLREAAAAFAEAFSE